MKTKSLFISAFGVLAMSAMTLLSCTKDETEPTGDGNEGTPSGEITAPVLSSDKESVVLAAESADQTAVTFSWTAAKDGESDADATYEIFINLSSKDIFTTPYRQELGSGLTASFTHAELNTILVEKLGAEVGQAADIQVMVYATPAEGEGLQSNKAALNVTTYVEQIEFPESLILLGSATPALWEMANGIEVAKTSDGVYTVENIDLRGSGNSGFKFYFSRNDGDYRIQVDMVNEDFKDLTIKIVIAKEDSQDIVPSRIAGYTDGQYKLTVNLNTLELTMERTGELSEITLPDKLYMQGDAVEWGWKWNEENTLNKISDKVYEAKNIKLTFGDNNDCGFKVFIANGQYSPYYAMTGDSSEGNMKILEVTEGDGPQIYPGQCGYEDGTYDITMDFNTMTITLTAVKDPNEGAIGMQGTLTNWTMIAVPQINDHEWEISGVELTIDENSNLKFYPNYYVAGADQWWPYYGQVYVEDETEFGKITSIPDQATVDASVAEHDGYDPAFYPGKFGYTSGTYTINVNTETMKVTLTKEE